MCHNSNRVKSKWTSDLLDRLVTTGECAGFFQAATAVN